MRLTRCILISIIGSLAMQPTVASAEHRVALLIGNSKYAEAESPPRRDLKQLAKQLERFGFRCEIRENLDDKQLRAAIERFAGTTPTRGTALLYFTGRVARTQQKGNTALSFLGTNVKRERGGYGVLRAMQTLSKTGGSSLNLVLADAPVPKVSDVKRIPDTAFGFVNHDDWLKKLSNSKDLLSALKQSANSTASTLSKSVTITGTGSKTISPPDRFIAGRKAGDEWVNSRGMVFCWCPPGKYVMGSPTTEPGRYPDEKQKTVTIEHGFWISKYELTLSQIGKKRPRKTIATHKNHPLTTLHLDDARRTLKRDFTAAEHKQGRLPKDWEYRLPSEEQWEYAARAGTKTARFFGNDASQLPRYANFSDKSFYNSGSPYSAAASRTLDDGVVQLAPVGSYGANPWGLYDVYGNVAEWCRNSAARGGSWVSAASSCRSAHRHTYSSRAQLNYLGFRFVIQRRQGGAR